VSRSDGKPFTQGLLAEGTGVKLDERASFRSTSIAERRAERLGDRRTWCADPCSRTKGKEEGVMVADLDRRHFSAR